MRIQLLVISVAATACAARPVAPTTPLQYACDDGAVVRSGSELTAAGGTTTMRRGWDDSEGEHFVVWPHTTTQTSAVEYVLPHDLHADAKTRVWDTSKGTAKVDWRMTQEGSCRVHGGYTEAFELFSSGKSLKQVASELHLEDAIEARHLVHDALTAMQRRYYASYTSAD
jgi:hypothetical protein